jgi:hypothetical protein
MREIRNHAERGRIFLATTSPAPSRSHPVNSSRTNHGAVTAKATIIREEDRTIEELSTVLTLSEDVLTGEDLGQAKR